jgi:hypothetical protein
VLFRSPCALLEFIYDRDAIRIGTQVEEHHENGELQAAEYAEGHLWSPPA